MQTRHWMTPLEGPNFNWQLLQTFLDVADAGSFRQVAIDRTIALNTVRGRVAELERITGRQLLERAVTGVTLTEDGVAVLIVARAMASAREEKVAEIIEQSVINSVLSRMP